RAAAANSPADRRRPLPTPLARIGPDIEFIRERTYWPQLSLVQVAFDEGDPGAPRILLLAMLQPGMPGALVPLLQDRAVTKVMHSASEDLVALRHACGALPEPLFDTQVAAGLAGAREIR